MLQNYILVIFFLLNIYVNVGNISMYPSFQSQLFHDLFSLTRYNKAAIPVRNNEPISVLVDLYIMDIVSLNLQNEVLTVNLDLMQFWTDELLTWEPEKYGGIKTLSIPADQIWNPDIVLHNAAGRRTNDEIVLNAEVVYTGEVTYEQQVQRQIQCPIDATYFPFDHHTCSLNFYTKLLSDRLHLDLGTENEHDAVINMLQNFRPAEFNIYNAHIKSSCNISEQGEDTKFVIDANGTELIHCLIESQISLARRPLHYMQIIVYPVVVVTLLSLLVFRLTPASGERISFCITLALVYQILLMSIGDKMPQSADTTPLLSIYLTIEILMSSISLVLSIIVINLYNKGSSKQVPDWMRWLFLDKLASVFCFKGAHRFAKKKRLKTKKSENGVDEMEEVKVRSVMSSERAKDQQEKDKDEVAEEWRAVSLVLDKLFFWVFLIITFVMGICMIIAVFVHYEGKPKEIVAQLIEEGAL